MKQNLRLRGEVCLSQLSAIGNQTSAYFRNKHKNSDRLIDASWQFIRPLADQHDSAQGLTKTKPIEVKKAQRLINKIAKKLQIVLRVACRSLKVGFGAPCYLQRYSFRPATVLLGLQGEGSCAKYAFSRLQPPKPSTRHSQGNLPASTFKTKARSKLPYAFYLLACTLFTFLFHVRCANARPRVLGATDVALTDSIKPLQIGDAIPETLSNLPLHIVKAGQEGSTAVKLQDYKGKLIILDFWATWCSPCVAAFPKMDSLRSRFDTKLTILPITDQNEKTVKNFFGNMQQVTGRRGFSAVNDQLFRKYFRHRTLPHYVWIGQEGEVMAITNEEEVNAKHIAAILTGRALQLKVKSDFKQKNKASKSSLLFKARLTRYQPGKNSSVSLRNRKDTLLLKVQNLSIFRLFQIAFSEMKPTFMRNSRVMIESANKAILTYEKQGGDPRLWAENNAYSYDISVMKNRALLFAIMRDDIQRIFPFAATIEKRKTRCLVMKRLENAPSIASVDTLIKPKMSADAYSFRLENMPWSWLPTRLADYYLQNLETPLIDETGIKGKVNINLKAKLADLAQLKKALASYGISLVEEEREIDMLVISDKK